MFSEKGIMRLAIAVTIWGAIMVMPLIAFVINWLWWTVSGLSILSSDFVSADRVFSAITQAAAGSTCLYYAPKGYVSARDRLVKSIAKRVTV